MSKRYHFDRHRFLVFGTICLGVFVVLAGVNRLQRFRTTSAILRSARSALEKKEWDQAISRFQRYLLLNPTDNAVRCEVADMTADKNSGCYRPYDAFRLYEDALAQETGRDDLREKLIPLAVQLEAYSDAINHIQILRENGKSTTRHGYWLAEAYEGMSQFESAVKTFDEILRDNPNEIGASSEQARLYRHKLERSEQADDRIREMLLANADKSLAHERAANYYWKARQRDNARQAVTKSLTLDPDSVESLWLGASIMLDDAKQIAPGSERDSQIAQSLGIAEGWIQRGLTLRPRDQRFYVLKAQLAAARERGDEAEAALNEGLRTLPGNPELTWRLCDLLQTLGKYDDVRSLISQLNEMRLTRELIQYQEARYLAYQQEWHRASHLLQSSRHYFRNDEATLTRLEALLGDCYRQMGDFDQQVLSFRRAIQADPLFIPARQGLAQGLMSLGRIDEAIQEYRLMIDLPTAPSFGWTAKVGWATVARVLILRNISSAMPNVDWSETEKALDELAAAEPQSVDAALLRAEVRSSKQEFNEARKILEDVQPIEQRDQRIWIAMAILEARQQHFDKASAILDEFRTRFGSTADSRVARIQFLAMSGDRDLANYDKFAEFDERWKDGDRRTVLLTLADYCLAFGDLNRAKTYWERAAQLSKGDIAVRLILFDAAIYQKDFETSEKLLDEIKEIEGENGTYHRFGLACRLLADHTEDHPANLGRIRTILSEVKSRRLNWSRIPRLEAVIDEIEGKFDYAAEHLIQAIALGERSPTVVRHAAQLLFSRQRYEDAQKIMNRWESQTSVPLTPELNRLAAEISLQAKDVEGALTRAKRVTQESNDPSDLTWLAEIHLSNQQYEEAEAALKRSLALKPLQPLAWSALVRTCLSRKQDVEETLAGATKALEQENPAELAACFELAGDLKEAERRFLKILEAPASTLAMLRQAAEYFQRNRRDAQAETSWRRLLARSMAGETHHIHAARRGLAELLSRRGDYTQVREGLALLQKNLDDSADDPFDLRIRAEILTRRGGHDERMEALALFKRLQEKHRLTTQDRQILADIYLAEDDFSKSREELQSIMVASEDARLPTGYYLALLLRRGELSEARIWLDRMKKSWPKFPMTIELDAEFQAMSGRQGPAIRSLISQREVDAFDGESTEAKLRRTCDSLERLHVRLKDPAALGEWQSSLEALYNEWENISVEGKSRKAAFLARVKKWDESLALYELLWKELPPSVVSHALATTLVKNLPDKNALARAEKLIRGGLAQPTAVGNQWVDLGLTLELMEKFDDAVASYRTALEKDARNFLAMNNLAWLMALKSDNPSLARDLIEKAISIAGPHPRLIDTRAQVFFAAGKSEEARKDWEGIVTAARDPAVCYRLAVLYLRQGESDKAKRLLARAKDLGLSPETLHALERPFFHRLVSEIESSTGTSRKESTIDPAPKPGENGKPKVNSPPPASADSSSSR